MIALSSKSRKNCGNSQISWKLNSYSYGLQFGINCTALDQSKLSNFVECTIRSVMEIKEMYPFVTVNERMLLWINEIGRE